MKKQITAVLLTAVLIFSLLPAGNAFADVKTQDYSQDIAFLCALDMSNISASEAGSAITRREAAIMAMSLYRKASVKFEYNNEFPDITADDIYAGKLAVAVKNGIIAKNRDGRFIPSGKVSYIEALKMVFNALNFGAVVKDSGQGDAKYYLLANQYDVKLSARESESISIGEMAHLVACAAEAPLMRTVKVSQSGDVRYDISDDVTPLSEYYGIKKTEGVVAKNNYTSLYEKTALSFRGIEIDGVELKCSDKTDTAELLSKRITAFYSEEDMLLLYVRASYNTQSIVIECENIEKFSDNTYYCTQGEKTVKYNVLRNASVIYNGVAVTSDEREAVTSGSVFVPKNGSVELIKNSSGYYECIKITDYKNFVVQGVDVNEKRIIDKFDSSLLDLGAVKNLSVCDSDGESVTLEYLEGLNVVSAALSLDGSKAHVVVTAQAVEGVLSSTGADEVQIEGEIFRISESLTEKINAEVTGIPDVGEEITAYLDARGLVAALEVSKNNGWAFGYIISRRCSEGLNKKIQIKMLTEDNTIEVYDLAERLRLDGESYRDSCAAETKIPTEAPIKFRTDAFGKIKDIDTPATGSGEARTSLKKHYEAETAKWISYNTGFSGYIFMKSGATVFNVPQTPTGDDRDYNASKLESSFEKDIEYDIVTYEEDPDELVDTLIIKKSSTGRTVLDSDIIYVVDRVVKALDG